MSKAKECGVLKKSKTRCYIRDKDSFSVDGLSTSRCLVSVCVGQQTHEGDHFLATIELLNKSFSSCVILLADSLQRHTMAIYGKNEADYYYQASLAEGVLWLRRNERYYGKLKNLEGIVRWDYWLKHPRFEDKKRLISKVINDDKQYQACFHESVDTFVHKFSRRFQGRDSLDLGRLRRISSDYVLEECAVMCLWEELGCEHELYPNKHNPSINATRDKFILSGKKKSLEKVTLGFRNAKELSAQKFFCLEDESLVDYALFL